MSDPRRVRVPWYAQRWHLRYILPAALFWSMAVGALRHVVDAPVGLGVLALFSAFIAVLFTRIAWQARLPLRSARARSDEVA